VLWASARIQFIVSIATDQLGDMTRHPYYPSDCTRETASGSQFSIGKDDWKLPIFHDLRSFLAIFMLRNVTTRA
jgi:hypothetical protein